MERETKGRSIEEIDAALAKPASLLERAPATDCLLEGDGFELSLPPREWVP
jgi:hypothetical protein